MAFDWDTHKDEILRLYRVQGHTLERIRKVLGDKYPKFRPSTSSYRTKLREWKALKYGDREKAIRQKSKDGSSQSSIDTSAFESSFDTTQHAFGEQSYSFQTMPVVGKQGHEHASDPQLAVSHRSSVQVSLGTAASPRTPPTISSKSSAQGTSPSETMATLPPTPVDLPRDLGHLGTSSRKLTTDSATFSEQLLFGDWLNDDFTSSLGIPDGADSLTAPSTTEVSLLGSNSYSTYELIFPERPNDNLRSSSPTSEAPLEHALAAKSARNMMHPDLFTQMIEAMNLDMNGLDSDNNTPLYTMACHAPSLELLTILMHKATDINHPNLYGETFLNALDPTHLPDSGSAQRFLDLCLELGFDFERTSLEGISGYEAVQKKWPKFAPRLIHHLQTHNSVTGSSDIAGPSSSESIAEAYWLSGQL